MNYKITYSNAKNGWVKLMPDGLIKITIPFSKSKDKSFEESLINKGKILVERYNNKGIKKIETITDDYVMVFGDKVSRGEINGDLEDYLKEKLYNISLPIIEKYSKELGMDYNRLYVKKLKTKWGSCSSIQNISLNFHLVHLPLKFIKYVVIHEVCHLKEKNHSKQFWDLVGSFYGDYEEVRKDLKRMVF